MTATGTGKITAGGAHHQRWPASVAVLIALGAQLALPAQASLGSRWLLPALQTTLLLPLIATNPVRLQRDHPLLRITALVSAGAVLAANAVVLVHLVLLLLAGSGITPQQLLRTGLVLIVTNVIATSVMLWELDRGGPFARDPIHQRPAGAPDLLFPQMTLPSTVQAPQPWLPSFLDYLFVGFTMSTAFSPTDTLPLSRQAKAVFMLGATVAITTFVIVAARAANIL